MADKVIAIDIGFAHTGLACFEVADTLTLIDFECVSADAIKKKKGLSQAYIDADRITRSIQGIVEFLDRHAPVAMVVELPTGGSKSSRATRAMGIATAMIIAISVLKGIPGRWYNPFDVKKAAVDKPHADKDEMMEAMAELFPEILVLPKSQMEHVADACACMLADRIKEGNNGRKESSNCTTEESNS